MPSVGQSVSSTLIDMARIRIRQLCSVVLFITGKENICFFYGARYPSVKP